MRSICKNCKNYYPIEEERFGKCAVSVSITFGDEICRTPSVVPEGGSCYAFEIFEVPSCPHCGASEGTWLDRSIGYDSDGNEKTYEIFPNRCCACGKNVDAPKEYYK